jgi:hypothetical protein
VLCQKFGWDYFTYESQPAKFIEELLIIMNQEALKEKQEAKKNKISQPQGFGRHKGVRG